MYLPAPAQEAVPKEEVEGALRAELGGGGAPVAGIAGESKLRKEEEAALPALGCGVVHAEVPEQEVVLPTELGEVGASDVRTKEEEVAEVEAQPIVR